MIKKILILIILLLTASFSSYAKRVVIEVPEITVPDLTLPTEFEFWGYLTFKNNWLTNLIGNTSLPQVKIHCMIGSDIVSTGSLTQDTENRNRFIYKVYLDLRNARLEWIEKVRNYDFKIRFLLGDKEFYKIDGSIFR